MLTRRNTLLLPFASLLATAPFASAAAPRAARAPLPSATARTATAPYKVASVQTVAVPTHAMDGQFLPEALAANLKTMCDAIAKGRDEVGAKLYVFSEFCLQRQRGALSAQQWAEGSITIDSKEMEALSRAAQDARAYIAFNPVERIPQFPGRYFLSGVLIGPNGNILKNYRKLYDLTNKTRPTDILPQWLDAFGPESLFPVADTEIGRIAVTIGSDLAWPELARSFVFRGAEILANCYASPLNAPSFVPSRTENSPDIHDPVVPVMSRRMRAYENLAYVVTSNLGPASPDLSQPMLEMQPSEIIDFTGNVLATSVDSKPQLIEASFDIEALRRARCTPGPSNILLQLQAELHGQDYTGARFAAPSPFGAALLDSGDEHDSVQKDAIADLVRRGIFKAPVHP